LLARGLRLLAKKSSMILAILILIILILAFAILKKSAATRRRRWLAEGAVLASHGDAGEQVEGSERVGAGRGRGDVAGQSELLHKGLALSEGARCHWRRSAQFQLAQGRAGAAVNAVLVTKVALLSASLNAVTADGLAGRVVESGLNADAVPAVLDLAVGVGAAVAGDVVVVVALLNVEDDAITADGAAVGEQSCVVNTRPADLLVASGVAAVAGDLVAVVAFPEVVVNAVAADLDAVGVTEGGIDSVASPADFNGASRRATTRD
jgi:hypothetical protein